MLILAPRSCIGLAPKAKVMYGRTYNKHRTVNIVCRTSYTDKTWRSTLNARGFGYWWIVAVWSSMWDVSPLMVICCPVVDVRHAIVGNSMFVSRVLSVVDFSSTGQLWFVKFCQCWMCGTNYWRFDVWCTLSHTGQYITFAFGAKPTQDLGAGIRMVTGTRYSLFGSSTLNARDFEIWWL